MNKTFKEIQEKMKEITERQPSEEEIEDLNNTFNTVYTLDEIQYGEKDVLNVNEFNPKDAKVLISFYINGEVLDAVKATAKWNNIDYKELINKTLSNYFLV